MTSHDPLHPNHRDAGEPEGSRRRGARPSRDDVLRGLEERLDRASSAAERLIAEATAQATGAQGERRPPPAGWQVPDTESGRPGDGDVLVQIARSLRELVPPDLQRRLAEALRELLVAVRALIDWYLERVERRRAEPTEVQDIPIV